MSNNRKDQRKKPNGLPMDCEIILRTQGIYKIVQALLISMGEIVELTMKDGEMIQVRLMGFNWDEGTIRGYDQERMNRAFDILEIYSIRRLKR